MHEPSHPPPPSPTARTVDDRCCFDVPFLQARRLLQGVDVTYSLKRPSATAYLAALATFLTTAISHALARAVVFSKIRRVRPPPPMLA